MPRAASLHQKAHSTCTATHTGQLLNLIQTIIAFSLHYSQIDIVKHPGEIEGKSTAVHAKLLAPDHVNIHIYPDIPDYTKVGEKEVLTLFNK